MGTRVIHIQDWDPEDPRQVYIGRAGHGQKGFFGNPIRRGRRCLECGAVHRDGGSTLACYEAWLVRRLAADGLFRDRVRELAGKVLVCFCKTGPCHGDILAWHAERLTAEAVDGYVTGTPECPECGEELRGTVEDLAGTAGGGPRRRLL